MTEYCHIRISIGIVPGSIVTPHYNPILSKIIAYSPTSCKAAIRGLVMALDWYLISGNTVRHNIPFVRGVLQNHDFVARYTPTNFVKTYYPDEFVSGLDCLSEVERCEIVVIARKIVRRRTLALGGKAVGVEGSLTLLYVWEECSAMPTLCQLCGPLTTKIAMLRRPSQCLVQKRMLKS